MLIRGRRDTAPTTGTAIRSDATPGMHASNHDPLLPIHEWPGVATCYELQPGSSGSATFRLEVAFDQAQAGDAPAALAYYEIVRDQLADPRTAVSVTTALAEGPLSPASATGLGAELAELVSAIVASLDAETPGAPPAPLVLTAGVPVSHVTRILEDLFPVWVAIEIAREEPQETPSPEPSAATSPVPPRLAAPETPPPAGPRDWALGFEAAFEGFDGSGGLLKVLAADSSPPGGLWALKWSASEGVFVSFGNARGDAAGAPVYFARRPLATRLVSGDVEIHSYGPDGAPAQPAATSFAGIDLELWGIAFLQAFDRLLAPESSAAIAKLDGESYGRLIDARARIATAIASAVSWVFEDQMPRGGKAGAGDLEAARTHFRESLLVSLETDLTTNAIVQVPAMVIVKPPFSSDNSALAAELVGTPIARGGPDMEASLASLPTESGTWELSFLVAAAEPSGSADLCLGFDHCLSGIGHRRRAQWSSRLRFLAVDEGLRVPMGELDVPVPLHAHPAAPRLVEQSIGPAHDPPESLAHAVEASYALTLAAPTAAQDALHLSLLFNGATSAGDEPGLAPNPPFAQLARFNDFQARYMETALAAIEAGTPDAAGWLRDVAGLVEDVAEAWPGDAREKAAGGAQATGTAEPPAPFAWDFVLEVPDQAKPNRLLLRWDGTGTAPPESWPAIDGARGTPGSDGAMVYTLGPSAATAEPTLVWPDLSVLTHQSISAAASIVRNESLAWCGGARRPRTTNPSLVYRGPSTAFQDPALAQLEVPGGLTIESTSLQDAVNQLVTQVMRPAAPDAQVDWSLGVAYSFADEGGLRSEVPVLQSRTAVTTAASPRPGVETTGRFAASLAQALANWHRELAPSDESAALLFSVALFAAGGSQPLARVRDVEAPVSSPAWWTAP